MKTTTETGKTTVTCVENFLSTARWACLLAIPFAVLAAGCDSQTQSEGAHVHGIASLMLAIDDPTTASIEFVSPAESIYGFEHEASTADEIAARDEAITALESRFDEMLNLPDALGCRIEDAVVEVVLEDEHGHDEGDHDDGDESVSGEHAEVRASYQLACTGQLEGAEARIVIGEIFAGVETLNVTVLSGSGQRGVVLEGGVGSVDL